MPSTADPFKPRIRPVRPRRRNYLYRPVVAIVGDATLNEDGEIGTVSDLTAGLPNRPSTIFVKVSAADFVGHLDTIFSRSHPNSWQWRASSYERDIHRPDGVRVAARMHTVIHYFGWKGRHYHKILDPVTMYGHKLDDIWPGDESWLVKLVEWGQTLRDFCHENKLDIRPTTGGVGVQFLTDSRFYPDARRKVPSVINERSREQLPGNHYDLSVAPRPDREFRAHYLDQHRAHHYHAATTALPDANSLYAYGRFLDLAHVVFPDVWPEFCGLYCLDLDGPKHVKRSWVTESEQVFVFSNELPHLYDMGYRVTGVRAAWGSFKRDTGLQLYAKWAMSQLDHYGDKPWLKPLLLATYGTLATRPRYGEAIFRLAAGGETVTVVTGNKRLTGQLIKRGTKLEPGIANVIHRGMIEANTRSESVGLAQYLSGKGHRILSIYADAVIVEDDCDKQLPLLPEPWRSKETLNHLQFISQQAFISGEMTKLPGVSQELRQYRQHSPGYAPRKVVYSALTGQSTLTDRRI